MRVACRPFARAARLATLALLATSACRGPAPAPRPDAGPSYRLVDATPALWRALDETAGRDDAAWLAAYRAQVVAPHQRIFALARGGLDDSSLVRWRRVLLRDPAGWRAAGDSLPARLALEWARFARALPDVGEGATVYVLPAPANVVGGWYRPLPDGDVVVYGLPLLAGASSDADFGVRTQHELVHLYHARVNAQIRRMVAAFFLGDGDHRTALHELLWIEGLAVYASLRLTPEARRELVIPTHVAQANDAVRARTARLFRDRLDETDRATVEALVYGGSAEVPPQAVNYLGLLVAERLGERRTLAELARLDGAELRAAISDALVAIEAERP